MRITTFPTGSSTEHLTAAAPSRLHTLIGHIARTTLYMASAVVASSLMAPAAAKESALNVSGPHVEGNLAVYFIHGQSRPGPVPLTLAEAMRKGRVTVHETGRVEQLLIENTGDQEVFVQAGDIVKGGRQDRVLTISLLLPPNSGKISIGSYCVEQGRWSRRGTESVQRFSSAESAMPSRAAKIAILSAKPAVRTASRRVPTVATGRDGALLPPPRLSPLIAGSNSAQETRSVRQRIIRDLEQRRANARQPSRQQEIWRNVADIQRKLTDNLATGVRSKTSASSLQLSLEHQRLVEAREKMAAALLPLGAERKDVIGFAFAINGRINSAEIYPSNGLFAKMWPKLLKASITEAIAEKTAKAAVGKAPKPAAIKSFLDDAAKGKADTARLHHKLKRERRESDRSLSLATHRADGTIVHHSVLAR